MHAWNSQKNGETAQRAYSGSHHGCRQLSLDDTVDVREEHDNIIIEPAPPTIRPCATVGGHLRGQPTRRSQFRPAVGKEAFLMIRRYIPEAGDIVWCI